MNDIEIREDTRFTENEVQFEDGEISFSGGTTVVYGDHWSHTFSKENTRKLYLAMKAYYAQNP